MGFFVAMSMRSACLEHVGAWGGRSRQAGRQADGQGLPRPVHSGWVDSRAEKKTRRQGNQSETNRFPLEVRKSRCCGCWWPVRLQATSISARPSSAGCQRPAFVRGLTVGLLPPCLASFSVSGHPPAWRSVLVQGVHKPAHEGACTSMALERREPCHGPHRRALKSEANGH